MSKSRSANLPVYIGVADRRGHLPYTYGVSALPSPETLI